ELKPIGAGSGDAAGVSQVARVPRKGDAGGVADLGAQIDVPELRSLLVLTVEENDTVVVIQRVQREIRELDQGRIARGCNGSVGKRPGVLLDYRHTGGTKRRRCGSAAGGRDDASARAAARL